MGSAKSVGKAFQQNIEDSVSDIKQGIQTGDVLRIAQGSTNFLTKGTQRAMGIKGQTELEREARDAAGQEEQDAARLDALNKQGKIDKIAQRLDASIKLRQKAPGRQQTLLTSLLEPSKTNPQTTLITTMNGKK
jgi:hypothetical protein